MSATAKQIAEGTQCGRPSCTCGRPSGPAQFTIHCPSSAHDDQHPSATVKEGPSALLLKCHSRGCSFEEMSSGLKAKGLWDSALLPVRGVIPLQQSSEQATASPVVVTGFDNSELDPVTTDVTALQMAGLTLEQLADAKKLPVEFLKGLGLSTVPYIGNKAVRITYLDEHGATIGTRYRTALAGGDRFRWKSGSKVQLYGRAQLGIARKVGWILIVEGESDCWTGWSQGLPLVGVPGKSTWQPAWAEFLRGIDVYIWQEPGASDFTRLIAKDIPDARVIIAPAESKDFSEAHVNGKADLPAWLAGLRANAIPVSTILDEQRSADIKQAEAAAGSVADERDILARFEDSARSLGYGGTIGPLKLVYLAETARVLPHIRGNIPPHVVLLGPASAGKSFLEQTVRAHLPESAVHVIAAGSPRALIYDDADLRHRALVFGEADSLPAGEDNPAASAVRNLLQDGRLSYEVTEKDPSTGHQTVRVIEKEGPTIMVTTSTKPLGDQLMSRLLTVDVPYDKDQIKAALMAQAELENLPPGEPDPELIAYQELLQLRAPMAATIPFAMVLAEYISKQATAPRIMRDVGKLRSLIKAHAVLHFRHRETDYRGRIVATYDDYRAVYELVRESYDASVTGVTDAIRTVVAAVATLRQDKGDEGKVRQVDIAKATGYTTMRVSRAVNTALPRGWLINNAISNKRNAVYNLSPGEPLPGNEALPTPDQLISNAITPLTGSVVSTPPIDVSGEVEGPLSEHPAPTAPPQDAPSQASPRETVAIGGSADEELRL